MNKRIVLIGVLLIVLGLIAAVIATTTFNNSVKTLASQLLRNATINSTMRSFAYVQISLSNASQIYVLAEMNKSANFYIFNSSAFGAWTASASNTVNSTGLAAAEALEGRGALFIAKNSTFVDSASPVAPNSTEDIVFSASNATEPAGTYYAVSDNTNGSASASNGTVMTKLVYYAPGTLSSNTISKYSGSGTTVLAGSVMFLILIIAGIILLVYGLIKKPKAEALPPQFQEPGKKEENKGGAGKPDDYISGIYDKIEGKGKKNK